MEFIAEAHIVLPDGKTIGHHMVPQLEQVYQTKKMPAMLPMLGD
jgi:hypothetical protein